MFAKLLNLCDYIVQILSYKCAAKKKGKKQVKSRQKQLVGTRKKRLVEKATF